MRVLDPRTVNPDLYSPVNHFSGFSVAGSKYRIDSWYGVLNDFPGFNGEPNAVFLRADAPRARRTAARGSRVVLRAQAGRLSRHSCEIREPHTTLVAQSEGL